MDISIICPCFNEANLIKNSLDDILYQIEKFNLDAEIIAVDDCSNDNSFGILLEYKEKIKVYQTSANSGQGGTPRNIGINNSNGEFIIFYDFGDKLFLDNLLTYVTLLNDISADVAILKHNDVINGIPFNSPIQIYKEKDYITNFSNSPQLISNPFSWSKIYRRNFIQNNNIFFGDQYLGQDKPFTWSSYLYCPKIIISSKIMYHHIFPEHKKNKMNQNNLKCVESIISIDSMVRPHFEKFGLVNLYNYRLLNRDIFGIILSSDGVNKLININQYEDAFVKLGNFLNDLINFHPGIIKCIDKSYKYNLNLLLNLDYNNYHNIID